LFPEVMVIGWRIPSPPRSVVLLVFGVVHLVRRISGVAAFWPVGRLPVSERPPAWSAMGRLMTGAGTWAVVSAWLVLYA